MRSKAGTCPTTADGAHPFLWGSSGFIYFWDEEGVLQRPSPPDQWWNENPGPHAVYDQYTQQPRERDQPWEPTLWPAVFRAHPGEEEIIPFPAPAPELHSYFIHDEFADGRTLLMFVCFRGGPIYSAVSSAGGEEIAVFIHDGSALSDGRFLSSFYPQSVSADGQYLAGDKSVEDGHWLCESNLHLSDVDDAWIVPTSSAPDGLWPHLSHEGLLLAFRGLNDAQLHVGELEIAHPE